jgi:hypothetical protein
MRKGMMAAILIGIAVGVGVNYLVAQAIAAMPCTDSGSCNLRIGGALILVTGDIFASVIVVSELAKKKSLMSKG